MQNSDLDQITQQLAEVQRRLLDLPSDAFAERYQLQKQQDGLRAEAARFRKDWDEQRPDSNMLAELQALRSKLETIEGQKIDLVVQLGGGEGSGPGSSGWGAVGINNAILDAQGAGDIRARIGRILGILEDRGVGVPKSP